MPATYVLVPDLAVAQLLQLPLFTPMAGRSTVESLI